MVFAGVSITHSNHNGLIACARSLQLTHPAFPQAHKLILLRVFSPIRRTFHFEFVSVYVRDCMGESVASTSTLTAFLLYTIRCNIDKIWH